MSLKRSVYKPPYQEVIFQVVIFAIIFVFFGFDRRIPGIAFHQIFFFSSYIFGSLFISYVLLPRFFYQGKYIQFSLYVLLVVAAIIVIEEAILEQIFFPETRAKRFFGVFYNLMSTLPTLMILVGYKFAWDALGKQREVRELKNLVKESELQYLKSQINPHFLFNNLNNLYSFAIEQSPKTPDIILELSAVLRYMLYDCKAKYVPLNNEIEQLKNYINLSSLQIEGRGEVTFNAEEVASGYKIAPLILTVFVENAFKHSASSQTGDIQIEVSLRVTDNGMLHFSCQNTYLSQTNTQSLSRGIGLENVQKRLQLLYTDAHELNITKGETLYEVDLQINLNKTQAV